MCDAQKEVTIKAGTLVPLQAVNSVRAAKIDEGTKVNFRVSRDINIDGITVIPYGTPASGIVTEAKRSSWWGTRGRLGIQIYEIVINGQTIPIENSSIEIKGNNNTAIAVLLFCFVTIPGCFVCGGKAEMPMGYEIHANVARNITITL